ncbi:MAG: pantetheine-phosphate adenylyltransferase [Cyclobacteriaceae bacterium]
MPSEKVALFPGSFDPFTRGHHDIVMRGLKIFDKIVIAVGHNSAKRRYFDIDFMLGKIRETYKDMPAIDVITYDELTAELANKFGSSFLLRGLRNTTDFEYENTIAQVNKHLNNNLDTIFLITSPELAFISSSIIREVHRYGGDVRDYLPYEL